MLVVSSRPLTLQTDLGVDFGLFYLCSNPSHWGKLCFLSTPDGENCGLIKNLAVTGLVSTHRRESSLVESLILSGMESLESVPLHSINGMSKVFLNGAWVGACRDGGSFADELRSLRRRKLLHVEVCSSNPWKFLPKINLWIYRYIRFFLTELLKLIRFFYFIAASCLMLLGFRKRLSLVISLPAIFILFSLLFLQIRCLDLARWRSNGTRINKKCGCSPTGGES